MEREKEERFAMVVLQKLYGSEVETRMWIQIDCKLHLADRIAPKIIVGYRQY